MSFRRLLAWFSEKPRSNSTAAVPTRNRRLIAQEPSPASCESLETRDLLSASGFESLNQGILTWDAASGDWITIRYDGTAYVQESAADLNAVGRWSDPIAADLDGNGLQEIYLRDVKTGQWWTVNPSSSGEPLQYVSSWNPTFPLLQTLTGDINGDGRTDLLTFNSNGEWWVLSHNGSAYTTFALPRWATETSWTSFSVVDFNADGKDELIALDPQTGSWWIIQATVDSYSTRVIVSWNSTHPVQRVLTGDLDGNGRQELLAWDSLGDWWRISWNGSAYTTEYLRQWSPNGNWRDFVVADLNGDGLDEIIGQESNTATWWSISRTGSSYVSRSLAKSSTSETYDLMLVGDITGDRRDDVVSRDSLGNFWTLTWSGSAYQTQLVKNWAPGDWRNLQLLDTDGDGVQEIIGLNAGNGFWWAVNKVPGGYSNQLIAQWGTAGDYLYVFPGKFRAGNGIGLLGWDTYGDWWYSSLGGSTTNIWLAHLESPVRYTQTWYADLNNDGTLDVIGYDAARGNWWGLIHDVTGTHHRYLGRWNSSVNWETVTLADLDGDGRTDIAARDPLSGAWWGIISRRGAYAAQLLTYWSTTSVYKDLQVLDLNGDGRQELVARNATGGWWGVMYDGSAFRTQFYQGWTEWWNWKNVAVVDLEGDGKQEIIAQARTRGEWWELYWTGSGYSSRKLSTWTQTETYSNLLLGDINGDGRTDLVARNSRGAWWMLSYAGPNNYLTTYLVGWNTTSNWRNFAVADLNGDGKAEVVAQDSFTGNWWGIFFTGSGYDSRIILAGTSTWQVASGMQAADLNADGSQELIGYDSLRKTWWSLNYNGTAGSVQNLGGYNWKNAVVGRIPGVSDVALKHWLLKNISNLAQTLASDRLLAAKLIMNWAANNADAALSAEFQSLTSESINSATRPSDMYKEFFLPNRGGVYCGGFSIFLNNILKLFGYDSFTLNFGDARTSLTHVVVIVPIATGAGDWKYYILDPTFNSWFTDSATGRDLTVTELIARYQSSSMSTVTIVQQPLAGRQWLSTPLAAVTRVDRSVYTAGSSNSQVVIFYRPAYSIPAWLNEVRPQLLSYGYSTSIDAYVELILFRIFSVGNSDNSLARQNFINQMNAHRIPIAALVP